MPTGSKYLFVYGTLRRGSDNAMCRLLAERARFIAEGSFNGRLYRVSWYPCVVSSALPQDRVYGDVYELSAPDILALLDDYEECGDQYPQPWEYRREVQTVRFADGEAIQAWVYLYNHDVGHLRRIASGDFFSHDEDAALA